MIDYHVLGSVRVVENGRELSVGGARQRRLLAILLLHRNEVVSIDRIAEAVFAGAPTQAAQATLRSYVARLRRVVDNGSGDPVVVTRAPGYVLRVADDAVDAARFECLLADGRGRAAADDPVTAAAVLRQALELWRGDPYAEFAGEDWARPEAQRLAELRLVAQEQRLDAELACGMASELISDLEVRVDEDPLRESFRSKLMLALYRSGRQVDALRVMQDYRIVLADEVGLEPSPELARLEHQILDHDAALQLAEPAGRALRGYRLGERLGTGRDGTVHAGRLPGVDRDLAIRVVPAAIADQPDVVRSFDSMLRRSASLRDEAVVPIHDHWREPGAAYVVMRRLPGGTLRDRLDGGALPIDQVATLATRIGAALVAAADEGIVHGRVVPESILYDGSGDPYIADFPLGNRTGTPDDDVRAFAGLVAEAVTGRRPGRRDLDSVPGPVGAVLAGAPGGTHAPPIGALTAALVAELDREAGRTPAPALPRPVNPYKGLRAFDESDAADFFGRRDLVDEMLRRLSGQGGATRLLLVVGGSGSGKSSVVRAGLLPRVRADDVAGSSRWFVTTMLPGGAPFKELADALSHVATAGAGDGTESVGSPGPTTDELATALTEGSEGIDAVVRGVVPEGGQLLLVVDQLEELFTMAGDHDQRAFLDGIVHAVTAPDSRLRVVATVRADFYDRPLRFHRFGAAVRDTTVAVPAMTAADLEAAIVGPADRVGSRVDPALVAELVASVIDEPAALPSLQFTLYELAERSADGHLGLAAYRELGGVDGAIASRAETLYQSLDDDDRTLARRLFEQLVIIGPEGESTRRRTPRSELTVLAAGRAVDELIDGWAQARLVTYDRHPKTREPTVEVAHEALLREWPRLRQWIDDDRHAIVTAAQLRDAADDWEALGRDPGALYRGARLDTALEQVDGRTQTLHAPTREFLTASSAARDDEQRREGERVARQARANRRLRVQLAALTVALVIALVGGLLALDQRRSADDQRARAESEERVAFARELAASSVATLDEDPELSVLLALEAIDRTQAADGTVLPEAETALHQAVTTSRIVLTVPGVGGFADWSPDGSVFVTEGPEDSGLVDIRDAETGESVLSFTGHDIDINDVAFNHDGTMLATVGDDGAARIWDPATGDELLGLDGPGQVWGPSFSPDGRRFAAAWLGQVRVVDIASRRTALEVPIGANSTSFSPDGERLAIRDNNLGAVVVVDVATGAEVLRIDSPTHMSRAVAWSPDGRWLATPGSDMTARIWDATTGELSATLTDHSGVVLEVDWSADATRLATGSEDGTARVWEVSEAGARETVAVAARDLQGGAYGIAFSPDGEQLLTGDQRVTAAKIWDVGLSGGAEEATLPAPVHELADAAFTPDGRGVVASAADADAVVWDIATGEQQRTLGRPGGGVWRIEVSPDGRLVAATTRLGDLRVWDIRTGETVYVADPSVFVEDTAWSPDGDVLAVAAGDDRRGWITFIDRAGRRVAELREDDGAWPHSVDFSPDGERIVTSRIDIHRDNPTVSGARVWDRSTGEVLTHIEVEAQRVVFDPTGTRVATDDDQRDAALWDADSGRRLATFSGHPGSVYALAFDPAGDTLATASTDGTVRLWDVGSGTQELALRGHEGRVGAVEFSPDGSQLASVSHGEVRIWALDLGDLVEIAESRLTRGLSDAECRQHLHVDSCPEAQPPGV
jgi:WD40 repeat protein/DNA-binding SARP family transcriptional activator